MSESLRMPGQLCESAIETFRYGTGLESGASLEGWKDSIGDGINGCGPSYWGELCSQCAPGHFRRKRMCVECSSTDTRMHMFIAIGLFVGLLNIGVFVVPFEVVFAVFDLMAVCQMFYALGQNGISPPWPSDPVTH